MGQFNGRLVYIPEDSPLTDELDELERNGDIHCLDDLEDVRDLQLTYLPDGADWDESGVDLDTLQMQLDRARAEIDHQRHDNNLLWGLGGLLLGSWFFGN